MGKSLSCHCSSHFPWEQSSSLLVTAAFLFKGPKSLGHHNPIFAPYAFLLSRYFGPEAAFRSVEMPEISVLVCAGMWSTFSSPISIRCPFAFFQEAPKPRALKFEGSRA